MSFIMNSDKVYFLCLFDLLVTGVVVTVVSAWLEGGGGVVVVVARIWQVVEVLLLSLCHAHDHPYPCQVVL